MDAYRVMKKQTPTPKPADAVTVLVGTLNTIAASSTLVIGARQPVRVAAGLLHEYADFIASIARLTKDGERAKCKSSEDVSRGCRKHRLFDMPNDDAVDTVHEVIDEARSLQGRQPARPKAAKRD